MTRRVNCNFFNIVRLWKNYPETGEVAGRGRRRKTTKARTDILSTWLHLLGPMVTPSSTHLSFFYMLKCHQSKVLTTSGSGSWRRIWGQSGGDLQKLNKLVLKTLKRVAQILTLLSRITSVLKFSVGS